MRTVWNYLMGIADNLYRARTAATLARNGKYQQAREIMLSK
jgi:hypothetical protein